MNDHTHDRDDRFDAAMRQRHALAVDRLSSHTQARLQPRRRPAMATPLPRTATWQRVGWPVAAAFAAAMAVVVGLQLRPAPMSPAPAAAVVAGSDDSLDTVLDENPDFYLWLASRDATAIAME